MCSPITPAENAILTHAEGTRRLVGTVLCPCRHQHEGRDCWKYFSTLAQSPKAARVLHFESRFHPSSRSLTVQLTGGHPRLSSHSPDHAGTGRHWLVGTLSRHLGPLPQYIPGRHCLSVSTLVRKTQQIHGLRQGIGKESRAVAMECSLRLVGNTPPHYLHYCMCTHWVLLVPPYGLPGRGAARLVASGYSMGLAQVRPGWWEPAGASCQAVMSPNLPEAHGTELVGWGQHAGD